MKPKIDSNLYFAVLDAFQCQISHYEKIKRLNVGCAKEVSNPEDRQKHLDAAKDCGKWALEAHRYKLEFIDIFEPEIE